MARQGVLHFDALASIIAIENKGNRLELSDQNQGRIIILYLL